MTSTRLAVFILLVLTPFMVSTATCAPEQGDTILAPLGGDTLNVQEEAEPLSIPNGVYESQQPTDRTAAWEDANAPLAQLIDANGNGFATVGIMPAGDREYLCFVDNAVVASWRYAPTTNIVYLRTPSNDPVLGLPATLDDDDKLSIQAGINGGDPPLSFTVSFRIALEPAEDNEVWLAHMIAQATATISQDIPADNDGRWSAVSAGDTATYTAEWWQTLEPSQAPATLYPNATWELEPDES